MPTRSLSSAITARVATTSPICSTVHRNLPAAPSSVSERGGGECPWFWHELMSVPVQVSKMAESRSGVTNMAESSGVRCEAEGDGREGGFGSS
jgi:hypothetical protein